MSPPMTLNKVDLPQPDGPITPTNSPGATESDTPSTAVSTPSGVSKRLTMSSTTKMALADATFGAPASARSNGTVTAAIPRPLLGRQGFPPYWAPPSPIPHPAHREQKALRLKIMPRRHVADAGA